MQIFKTTTLLALGGAATFGGYLAFAEPSSAEAALPPNTIRVVEHPGYFETRGSAYDLAPGEYTFMVENRSGKDAGFVLKPAEGDPTVILIGNGETGEVSVELSSGNYTYFCPLIPTPEYPLSVK